MLKKAKFKKLNIKFKTQSSVYETVCELSSNQNTIENRMRDLEDKLCMLQVRYIFNYFY